MEEKLKQWRLQKQLAKKQQQQQKKVGTSGRTGSKRSAAPSTGTNVGVVKKGGFTKGYSSRSMSRTAGKNLAKDIAVSRSLFANKTQNLSKTLPKRFVGTRDVSSGQGGKAPNSARTAAKSTVQGGKAPNSARTSAKSKNSERKESTASSKPHVGHASKKHTAKAITIPSARGGKPADSKPTGRSRKSLAPTNTTRSQDSKEAQKTPKKTPSKATPVGYLRRRASLTPSRHQNANKVKENLCPGDSNPSCVSKEGTTSARILTPRSETKNNTKTSKSAKSRRKSLHPATSKSSALPILMGSQEMNLDIQTLAKLDKKSLMDIRRYELNILDQWCYINSASAARFRKQESNAMAQLYNVQQQVIQLDKKVQAAELDLQKKIRVLNAKRILEAQRDSGVFRFLGTLLSLKETLLKAMHTKMQSVSGAAVTYDKKEFQQALETSTEILGRISSLNQVEANKFAASSAVSKRIAETAKKENETLNNCASQLSRLKLLLDHLQSLQIEKIQKAEASSFVASLA